MRTKTLLLAVAALAAGIYSSDAQSNVYSQNVVGYCNVVVYGGGKYTMVANPFDNGNGNSGTNWLDPNNTLPAKTEILGWNGTGWSGIIKGGGPSWGGADLAMPPGSGFLVFLPASAATITNTFVGNVIVNSGGSITNTIPAGYSVWGSPIPYSGDLTSDTNVNVYKTLTTSKDELFTFNNGGAPGYNGSLYSGGTWGGALNVSVGEGFLLFNKGAATNWIQNADY